MYTSMVCIALATSLAASAPCESVTWHNDYSKARTTGQSDKKPLAVFIGNGADGQAKVCREGSLNAEVEKMLADSYVCVYVDVSTPAGQKLAADFGVTGGMGLVLSDKTGDLQAFSHAGDLSAVDMTRWVKHFADPSVTVSTTMSNTTARMSMYPPSGTSMMTNSGYIMYGSYPGSYSNGVIYGGCPNGNCGIRR